MFSLIVALIMTNLRLLTDHYAKMAYATTFNWPDLFSQHRAFLVDWHNASLGDGWPGAVRTMPLWEARGPGTKEQDGQEDNYMRRSNLEVYG